MVKITAKPETLFSYENKAGINYFYVINVITNRDNAVQVVYLDKMLNAKVVKLKEFLDNLTRYSDTGEFTIQEGVDMVQFNLMMEG